MPRARTLRSRLATLAATAAVGVAGVVALGATAAGPAQADDCPRGNVALLGIPGTNQGWSHNRDNIYEETDKKVLYGDEVWTAVQAIAGGGVEFDDTALVYPAEGTDGLDPVFAKIAYEGSTYQKSKDKGYEYAFGWMENEIALCPETKFILVGFSQGAHIVGDLAQTIEDHSNPVGPDQLLGAVLISDPAHNGTDLRSTEFALEGRDNSREEKERTGQARTRFLVESDNDRPVKGSLGRRHFFLPDGPVFSVCIYDDPVCDFTSARAAQDNKWRHGIYASMSAADTDSLAAWAGKQLADTLK